MAELIKKTDNLNQGREKLNAAITDAEAAKSTSEQADDKATQALAQSESTQTQLDTIVIEGDSSVEAAQARVDAGGTAYSTLKQRLDAEYSEVTTQLAQNTQDFLTTKQDVVSEYNVIGLENDDSIILSKNNSNRYDVYIHHKGREYQGWRMTRESTAFDSNVTPHANGDPFVSDLVNIYTLTKTKDYKYNTSSINFVGTWVDSTSYKYSNTTNDYAEIEFKGNTLSINFQFISNGGIAKVEIDGRADLCDAITLTNGEALVDTFKASSGGTRVTIANNLSDDTHTARVYVTGTKNASATDHRIYINDFRAGFRPFLENNDITGTTISGTGKSAIPSTVVKELAINVDGVFRGFWHRYTYPKVPNAYTIYIDGVQKDINSGQMVGAKEIIFEQDLTMYSNESGDFANLKVRHIFTSKGMLVKVNFEITKEIMTTSFYTPMGAYFAHYAKISNQEEIATLPANNLSYTMDNFTNAVLMWNENNGIVGLMQNLDVLGSKSTDPYESHFILDRTQGYGKVYFVSGQKGVKPIGYQVNTSAFYSIKHVNNPSLQLM